MNKLSALLYKADISIPIGIEFVKKDKVEQLANGKFKRSASVSKQVHFRDLVQKANDNLAQIDYVLADKWFSSAENMRFIKQECETDFILPLKNNRKVALSLADKETKNYQRVDSLDLQEGQSVRIYLEQVDFALNLTKAVYENQDGSVGILYLVTSDLPLSGEQINCCYAVTSPS